MLFPGTKNNKTNSQVLGFFLRLLWLGSLEIFAMILFILLSPHSPHVGQNNFQYYVMMVTCVVSCYVALV